MVGMDNNGASIETRFVVVIRRETNGVLSLVELVAECHIFSFSYLLEETAFSIALVVLARSLHVL